MGLGEAHHSSPMFNPMLATSRGWQGLVLNIEHGYVGPIEYIEPISNIHEEVTHCQVEHHVRDKFATFV